MAFATGLAFRASTAVPPHGAAAVPWPAPPVRGFTEMLDESQVQATTGKQWSVIARRSTVVVLNSWDYRLIPMLKRANPRVQVWVYKDLSGVRSDDCATATRSCGSCPPGVTDESLLSSGMGYCWVKRSHPRWLLTAAGSGQPLEFRGYPQTWETDYGNRAYQRQWIRNVLADVRRHGWDGVKVDNALTTAQAYGLTGEYRTDASVQRATYSALREIGPALRRARVASVVNVGYAPEFPGLWERWLRFVGGLEQEFYLSFSLRPNAVGRRWAAYQAEVSACVAQHKSCWFHTGAYAAVPGRTFRYALASFLLATDGRQLLAVGDATSIPAIPGRHLGEPTGIRHRVGSVWRRNFSAGVVVVNPTGRRLSLSLGGRYLDARWHAVSSIDLGPASGAVLSLMAHRGRR